MNVVLWIVVFLATAVLVTLVASLFGLLGALELLVVIVIAAVVATVFVRGRSLRSQSPV